MLAGHDVWRPSINSLLWILIILVIYIYHFNIRVIIKRITTLHISTRVDPWIPIESLCRVMVKYNWLAYSVLYARKIGKLNSGKVSIKSIMFRNTMSKIVWYCAQKMHLATNIRIVCAWRNWWKPSL